MIRQSDEVLEKLIKANSDASEFLDAVIIRLQKAEDLGYTALATEVELGDTINND